MDPEIDFKNTVLVTNRRFLQMLSQVAVDIPFQDFHIDLHMVHDTSIPNPKGPEGSRKRNLWPMPMEQKKSVPTLRPYLLVQNRG